MLRELQKLPRTRMQAFEYTTHTGSKRRVVVLSPKHPGSEPLPLVLALHGRGGDPAHTCGPWGDLPGYAQVIVICPQGQGNVLERYSWGAPGQIDDLARMPALVEGALPGLHVDRHRVYAVGASMGGMEALLLVARHPDLLRSAVAIDPVTDLAARYYALRSSDSGLVADARMRREIGGSPDLVPAAYQERSPSDLVDEIARSDTALAIWWSSCDREVPDQATVQAGRFASELGRANPRRPVWQREGVWAHSWPYRHELWRRCASSAWCRPPDCPRRAARRPSSRPAGRSKATLGAAGRPLGQPGADRPTIGRLRSHAATSARYGGLAGRASDRSDWERRLDSPAQARAPVRPYPLRRSPTPPAGGAWSGTGAPTPSAASAGLRQDASYGAAPMTRTHVRALVCGRCRHEHEPGRLHGTCEACQSPLLVDYDLDAVAATATRETSPPGTPASGATASSCPCRSTSSRSRLGEGGTPLLPAPRAGRRDRPARPAGQGRGAEPGRDVQGPRRLLRRVDGPLARRPRGRAADRRQRRRRLGGLRRRRRHPVHVAMPADAPALTRLEVQLHGAELHARRRADLRRGQADRRAGRGQRLVRRGDPARALPDRGQEDDRPRDRRAARLAAPDSIVYPAGGGVGLIGIGGVRPARRARLARRPAAAAHIVQAAGCAPLVRAFEAGAEDGAWEGARTIAAGLRVPRALGDFLVLRAVRETGGSAIAVDDEAILDALGQLAPRGDPGRARGGRHARRRRRAADRGDLRPDERVVLVVTGGGLTDRDALERAASRR